VGDILRHNPFSSAENGRTNNKLTDKTRVIELFRPLSGRADYKGARRYASAPNESKHTKVIKCTEFAPKDYESRDLHHPGSLNAVGIGSTALFP